MPFLANKNIIDLESWFLSNEIYVSRKEDIMVQKWRKNKYLKINSKCYLLCCSNKSWFDKVNFFGGKSGKSTWDFWKLCSVTPWLIILPKCIWWYIQIPTRIFFHEKSSVMLFQKNKFNHPIKTRVPYYLGWENFKKH